MVDDGESSNFISLASSDSSVEAEDDEEGKMITIIPKPKPNITSILDAAEPNIATSDIIKQNELPIGGIVPRKPGIRNVAKLLKGKHFISLGSNTFREEIKLLQKKR